MVVKLASLTNVYDFTLQKTKILNINFTQLGRTATGYPMVNVSFKLVWKTYFFEAFRKKGPELRVTTIPNGFFSFRRKLLIHISTRFTCLHVYLSLPLSISVLHHFSCLILSCLRYLRLICVLQLTIQPPSLSPHFCLPYKAALHAFFHSFISSQWLSCYLYNYFAATLSDFLFCFSFEINSPNI